MGSPEKRCLYEVLGLRRDCTVDEIRSAYKKLALLRHPDKLVRAGVPEAEATASFQELVNAYEVLSDPRERAWYDSHRSQILFSGSNPSNSSTSIPNLFSFFSNSVFSGYSDANKGFYKVYGDVFNTIYSSELNFAKKLGLGLGAVKEAPLMGNLESPYAQVTAFYNYWLGFGTLMDFCWVDQYDAMSGPNRKSRRVMEEENRKLRKKARREYNETVRGLAEFVKKRDKRVIDMQVKRNEEMERKRMEERQQRKEMERQKMERARAYEEPDWAKVEEDGDFEEDNEVDEGKNRDGKELYCVVCSKKFKSEKQWKNHEQSKKHKEKVAALREAYVSEEVEVEETEDEEEGKEEESEGDVNGHGFVPADDGIDELSEKFGGSFRINKSNSDGDVPQSSEEEEFVDIENGAAPKVVDESFGLEMDDDEASILEAMVSGHRRRKNANSMRQPKTNASSSNVRGQNDEEEMDFMAYNNQKSTRRKRGTKGDMGRRFDEEAAAAHGTEVSGKLEGNNGDDEGLHEDKISSHAFVRNENGKGDGQVGKGQKALNAKSKNSSKGKKQKAASKNSGSICDTCGKEFESRNKLHKHLGDTGHAALKFR